MTNAKMNQVSKEMGHSYYYCQGCKGTNVSEVGFLLLCEDCEEDTFIILKGDE